MRNLWNYNRDELNHGANENNDPGSYAINKSKITTS